MTGADLYEKVKKSLEDNPFLEVKDGTVFDYEKYRIKISSSENSDKDPSDYTAKSDSFKEYLEKQLFGIRMSEEKEKICIYLIENIDHKGYLTVPDRELAEELHKPQSEITECRKIIQGIEPYGTGAENLADCLMIQLSAQNELDDISSAIIRDGMELLALGKYGELARIAHCTRAEAEKSCEKIKKLNPIPSSGWGTGEVTRYIMPDVILEKTENNEISLHFTDELLEKVSYNTDYAHVRMEDELFRLKRSEARNLINALNNRRITMEKIVTAIVKIQKDYFFENKALNPLIMKDISAETGYSISTVSRTVKEKYIMYRGHIQLLKTLFSERAKSSYEDISAGGVKREIAVIIKNENPEEPFSDIKIAEMLKEYGVEISRRTVAKYRNEMGLPNEYRRKANHRQNG